MDFYPGQSIVCIDGDFDIEGYKMYVCPKTNHHYTIREIIMQPYSDGTEEVAFRLQEIVNERHDYCPPMRLDFEIGFCYKRFKPLDEHNYDLSVFTKMLTDVRAKEPA